MIYSTPKFSQSFLQRGKMIFAGAKQDPIAGFPGVAGLILL
jgi:hypothetical protein